MLRSAKSAKKGGRVRRFFRFVKRLFYLALILSAAGGVYLYHLSKQAEFRFSRSHKWDIPSKIYSDAGYYYAGIGIAQARLKDKLDRLGYRNTGAKVENPGDYSITPERLEIFLHDFNYPMQEFKGFPVRVGLSNGAITGVMRMDDFTPLAALKLEPEVISSVFGDTMEDRTLVKLGDVPQHLLEAIIITEDERFFRHKGIDYIAIVRAAVKDLLAFRIVEGGSTLTQQLVKNYFLTGKKSFTRKFKEAAIAMLIESRHTKKEILEAYINEIYLGQRGVSSVSGVGEAAKLYFAKNVDQLTLGECALLAGMIRAPQMYNPFTKATAAKERRDFILARLYREDLITKEEYKNALAEPIITPVRPTRTNLAPYFIDFVRMQLTDLYPGGVLQREGLRIFTTLDMNAQLIAERVVKEELARLEKEYAATLPKDKPGELQGALISIQPQTGYIRALVGGRDYNQTQFNHVTQALRQPGSVFKPFVYLTAFDPGRSEKLYAPASIIDDASFSVEAGGKEWSPLNYDKKEHGTVSLRSALTQSYNIATAKLALSAGLDAVVKTARDCGITSDLKPVPSVALGSFEATPLEIASAYTVFPNGGIKASPLSIIGVVTKEGEILEGKKMEMRRVFDPAPVYLTTSVLKDVVSRGTGAGARAYGFKGIAGGKTGTTSGYKDSWFVGFTPNYLALSWVGYDDNTATNMSGARGALPIWAKFMNEVVGDNAEDFPSPEGVLLVKVDPASGLLASPACPGEAYEPFIEGTEPEEPCTEKTTKGN